MPLLIGLSINSHNSGVPASINSVIDAVTHPALVHTYVVND